MTDKIRRRLVRLRYSVKAHPKASREKVVRLDEKGFEVWVTAPPDKGKANEAVREAVAAHLKVAKSRVSVVSGLVSRNKVVEVIPAPE
jgi:uncharacterized protein